MNPIDLHTHSTFSDGTYTPTQLMAYAKAKNLQAIALTDHDTLRGLPEARIAAKEAGTELIPGVEVATIYQGFEIHMLGLLINEESLPLQESLATIETARNDRNQTMLTRLQNQGIAITLEDLLNDTKQNVATRAHFARALVDNGTCATFQEAFANYLSPGCPAYLPRDTFDVAQTINMIHQGGGLAILAHPLLYKLNYTAVDAMVRHLVDFGLDGIEAIYATNTMADDLFLGKIAKKYRLCVSGGSDFHGANKKHIDLGTGRGNLFVPATLLDAMKLRMQDII